MQQLLPAQPFNLVRIILGLLSSSMRAGRERLYPCGARLRAWREQGVLIQEKSHASSHTRNVSRYLDSGCEGAAWVYRSRQAARLLEQWYSGTSRRSPSQKRPAQPAESDARTFRADFHALLRPGGSVEKILYDDNGQRTEVTTNTACCTGCGESAIRRPSAC